MKVFSSILYLLFTLSLTVKAQDSVKVALVQAHLAWGDMDDNLQAFEKRVRLCKGCDMIVFPELFTSGCEMKKRDKEEVKRSKNEGFPLSGGDQKNEKMGETFGGVGCRFYDL